MAEDFACDSALSAIRFKSSICCWRSSSFIICNSIPVGRYVPFAMGGISNDFNAVLLSFVLGAATTVRRL